MRHLGASRLGVALITSLGLAVVCSCSSAASSANVEAGPSGGGASATDPAGGPGDGAEAGHPLDPDSRDGGDASAQAEAPLCTHFSPTAAAIGLPSTGTPLLDQVGGRGFCATNGDSYWTTMDLDRDGKLDLVVTKSCNDATVGATKWLVYRGTAVGFGPTATAFSLPSAGTPRLDQVGGRGFCAGSGDSYWTTMDLDGDGKLDLVVTKSCSDATVGAAKWLVYRGTATGFGPTATAFSLPSTGTPLLDQVGGRGFCAGSGDSYWTTMDLDGDGKLDLVMTKSCSDATVGAAKWLVYRGTATGFGPTATAFSLPSTGTPLLDQVGGRGFCGGSNDSYWTTMDLDGDGKLDLVMTKSCSDATVGAAKWLVYRGTATGFGPTATAFGLPSTGIPLLDQVGGRGFCAGSGDSYWTTMDLDGDKRLDLVLTKRCGDGTVGVSTWQMFRCLP